MLRPDKDTTKTRIVFDAAIKCEGVEVDLDNELLRSVKTLEVWWLAEQDVFTFQENAPDDDMIFTK